MEDKHHVIAHLMDARAVDVHLEGKVEVSGLGETLKLDAAWIVNIAGPQPSEWKVLHKEPLVGGSTEKVKEKEQDVTSSTVVNSERSGASSNGTSKLSEVVEKSPVSPVSETTGKKSENPTTAIKTGI